MIVFGPTDSNMEFPLNFAILRQSADNSRPPVFQILFANSRNWGESHRIENVGWVRSDEAYPLYPTGDGRMDSQIYTVNLDRAGWPAPRAYKYWVLPFHFMRNGARIPVLDFQWSSWVPNHYVPIPISADQRNEILHVIRAVRLQRCDEIQQQQAAIEAAERYGSPLRARGGSPLPPQPPPVIRHRDHGQARYEGIFRENIQAMLDAAAAAAEAEMPRPPPLSIPPLPAEEEFVDMPPLEPFFGAAAPQQPPQVQTQPLQLPKYVGDLILNAARQGSEECPIAARPFRACEQLSVTSCFHVFDKPSLDYWLQDHSACPVCRSHVVNRIHG